MTETKRVYEETVTVAGQTALVKLTDGHFPGGDGTYRVEIEFPKSSGIAGHEVVIKADVTGIALVQEALESAAGLIKKL